MLKWFASGQIRNVASLAGNLCTASPISDLNPVLMSLGAVLTLAGEGQATREVAVRDFFVGYRRVQQCHRMKFFFLHAFQPLQSMSLSAAISRLAGAMMTSALPMRAFAYIWTAYRGSISECATGFGGMAAMTKPSPSVEAVLKGKSIDSLSAEAIDTDLLSAALAKDFKMRPGVPGGMGAYRETLAVSFGVKFLAYLRSEITDKDDEQSKDMRHGRSLATSVL